MLILQEMSLFILFRESKISNLVMLGKNNTTIEWIGLILDDIEETLDTIINIFALVLSSCVARLILEGSSVFILEKEPSIPLFEQVLVLDGSAAKTIAEWVENFKFGLVEIAWVALGKPAKSELSSIGIHTSRCE
jgi:hypothetical protein